MMPRITMVVATLLLFAGCAGQDFTKPGATGYRWQGSMLDGAKYLNSGAGTFVTARCPSVVRNGQWVTFECTAVTIQAQPPGAEAYSYVYKVKMQSLTGIPYGASLRYRTTEC